jgi:hypothetical protein
MPCIADMNSIVEHCRSVDAIDRSNVKCMVHVDGKGKTRARMQELLSSQEAELRLKGMTMVAMQVAVDLYVTKSVE